MAVLFFVAAMLLLIGVLSWFVCQNERKEERRRNTELHYRRTGRYTCPDTDHRMFSGADSDGWQP